MAVSNAELKELLQQIEHRFNLFEQAETARHQQISEDVKALKETVYGNGKEGLTYRVKTLWEWFRQYRHNLNAIWIAVIIQVVNTILIMYLSQFLNH